MRDSEHQLQWAHGADGRRSFAWTPMESEYHTLSLLLTRGRCAMHVRSLPGPGRQVNNFISSYFLLLICQLHSPVNHILQAVDMISYEMKKSGLDGFRSVSTLSEAWNRSK